jgi:hypothetical protein
MNRPLHSVLSLVMVASAISYAQDLQEKFHRLEQSLDRPFTTVEINPVKPNPQREFADVLLRASALSPDAKQSIGRVPTADELAPGVESYLDSEINDNSGYFLTKTGPFYYESQAEICQLIKSKWQKFGWFASAKVVLRERCIQINGPRVGREIEIEYDDRVPQNPEITQIRDDTLPGTHVIIESDGKKRMVK